MDWKGCRNKNNAGGLILLEERTIKTEKVKKVIKEDKHLLLFMKKNQKFIDLFCDCMTSGVDFTLRLEARGNKGEVIHVQLNTNDRESLDGAQKRIDEKGFPNKV